MDAMERTIVYLKGKLGNGVKVTAATPAERKNHDKLVVVSRSGGIISRFLDEPRMTIDCYGLTNEIAYSLTMLVIDYMDHFPDHDPKVSAVNDISFYRNDWTDGSPCYSTSCVMTVNR